MEQSKQLITATLGEFVEAFKVALVEHEQEKAVKQDLTKTLSIAETARMLKKAHTTINRMIDKGLIKTTIDKKITMLEINKYLVNN